MRTGKKRIAKLNIWQLLELLWSKYRLILISAAAFGLAVLLVTGLMMPHYYECAAYFGLETPVYKAGRTPSTAERHAFEEKVEICDQLLRTDGAIAEMLGYADPDTDAQKLMEMVYAEPDLENALIRVAVRGEDAEETGRLAEKIGRLLPKLSEEEPIYRKSVDEEPKRPVTPRVLRDTLSAMIFGLCAGASFVVVKHLFFQNKTNRNSGKYQKTGADEKPKRHTGAFERTGKKGQKTREDGEDSHIPTP